jgi:hypothetical protein
MTQAAVFIEGDLLASNTWDAVTSANRDVTKGVAVVLADPPFGLNLHDRNDVVSYASKS